MEATNVQGAQNEEGKEKANYDKTIKKLVALLGGEKELNPKVKLPAGDLSEVVTALTKEKKEATIKEVKDELSSLLQKKVEMDKAFKEKERELEKLKKDKMKEFSEAANKLFNKIENIGQIEQDYYNALQQAQ